MEDLSSLGISLRTVPVRLNEGNIENETIVEHNKSLYVPSSSGNITQDSHLNKSYETSQQPGSLNASSDIKNSQDRVNYDGKSLMNGCCEYLQNDVNCIHLTVNGVDDCTSYDLIDAHIEELNQDHRDHLLDKTTERTEKSYNDIKKSLQAAENSMHADVKLISDSARLTKVSTINCSLPSESTCSKNTEIIYIGYDSEIQMPDIIKLIQKDLSEPYSIYTYRYFIHNWPKLCFLALHRNQCVGAIVCKLDVHKKHSRRGYIAMLAVDEKYRKRKIGSNLVLKAIDAMVEDNADEVVLETEITNKPALKLYENLGFVRDKRLFRYYLNGVDALRLKLWLR